MWSLPDFPGVPATFYSISNSRYSMLGAAVRSLKTEAHRLPAWQQRDAVGNA